MIIKEYRIVLPMTVEDYQVAQLYSVARASENETGGGEGIEVLKNEPYVGVPLLNGKYNTGQYTHKIYHVQTKVPWWVRKIAPKGALSIHEEAWNAYPYCRTVLTNPDYMKENFMVKIESMHLPDRGNTQNAHELSPDLLAHREVIYLDIANDPVDPRDYKKEHDPSLFKSEKTGRGPLTGEWSKTVEPVMCCYKLVTIEFKWWGLQGRVEGFLQEQYPRLFNKFLREVFCWPDLWYGLTMEDIRRIEDDTQKKLDEQRRTGPKRGMETED